MYSGTTFRVKSGRIIGVHQRIDRIARRSLTPYIPRGVSFPTTREILHFEGKNGPDGIKSKRPGVDEPWHFIDPDHVGDQDLMQVIRDHLYNLVAALQSEDKERSAFEAAWLSHAIVDGLTPAHHYPLEEKLEELRGEGMATRKTKRQKVLMPGKNKRHMLRNNWEFWGAKGVMTSHVSFEMGIASAISTTRFGSLVIAEEARERLRADGYESFFLSLVADVSKMGMYQEFMRLGWTGHLARETRRVLIPLIVEAVVLAWYYAAESAESK